MMKNDKKPVAVLKERHQRKGSPRKGSPKDGFPRDGFPRGGSPREGSPKDRFPKIDLKDRKILYELDVNARAPASEIGKRVGLSKQVVSYRIVRLLSTGVIHKFNVILNNAGLGYTLFKIFLRLQNVNVEKQEEIIHYLTAHERTQYVITCDGLFDLIINVYAQNALELYGIIKEIEAKFGHYFAEREMITMVYTSFFFRDYLLGRERKEERKQVYFGSTPGKVEIDALERGILSFLGNDARTPIATMAKALKASSDRISSRIKKLEKANIIQHYPLQPDFTRLNQSSYKVLFTLHNLSERREKALFTYCAMQPNIWFHSKSLGRWDLEINIDVDHVDQFRKIMMELKLRFSDIIRDYLPLEVSKIYKFNFFPFGGKSISG